jgi:hypothetical protein
MVKGAAYDTASASGAFFIIKQQYFTVTHNYVSSFQNDNNNDKIYSIYFPRSLPGNRKIGSV